MPKAYRAAAVCAGLWIHSRRTVITFDGELSVIVFYELLCLYYITISAGFQPVFLFLYKLFNFLTNPRDFTRSKGDFYEQI